jgi:hypothetical protein
MRHHPSWSEVKAEVMKNTVPLDATCATCRWWHPPAPAAAVGKCHRYAPSTQGWPTTSAETDVCGEWTTDYLPEERTGRLIARQTRK